MTNEFYLAKDKSNKPRNWHREVWYITFTMLISVIRKYKMLPLVATSHRKKWCQQRLYLHLVLTSIWDTTRHGPFCQWTSKEGSYFVTYCIWVWLHDWNQGFSSNFESLQWFLTAQLSKILDSDWSFLLGPCHEVLRGSAAIKMQTSMTMLLKDEQGQCHFRQSAC